MLLVHGRSNSGASWATLVGRLEGFHCVVLDRPGYGLSDPLGAASVDDLATVGDTLVVDALDALGLDSAHLMSTSFDGYMALRAAAGYPRPHRPYGAFRLVRGGAAARLPVIMRLAACGVGLAAGRVAAIERTVRWMFRQIGLGQALDAGRIPQEALDWYVALLRHTDTIRNEFGLAGWVEQLVLSDSVLGPPNGSYEVT